MSLRARLPWLLVAPLVVVAGLASRRPGLPAWVHLYAGDALYAVLIAVLCGAAAPGARPAARGAVALAICVAIEVSQTWAGLEAVRATRIGALVLGRGFLWSDLVAYAVGVGAVLAVESAARKAR